MKIEKIAEKAYNTALKRQQNGANVDIKKILKHCAGEVVEAAEKSVEIKTDANKADEYAEELADIVLCVFIAAYKDGINIESAIIAKQHKNEARAANKGDKK